jgi:hypothetical protein
MKQQHQQHQHQRRQVHLCMSGCLGTTHYTTVLSTRCGQGARPRRSGSASWVVHRSTVGLIAGALFVVHRPWARARGARAPLRRALGAVGFELRRWGFRAALARSGVLRIVAMYFLLPFSRAPGARSSAWLRASSCRHGRWQCLRLASWGSGIGIGYFVLAFR